MGGVQFISYVPRGCSPHQGHWLSQQGHTVRNYVYCFMAKTHVIVSHLVNKTTSIKLDFEADVSDFGNFTLPCF